MKILKNKKAIAPIIVIVGLLLLLVGAFGFGKGWWGSEEDVPPQYESVNRGISKILDSVPDCDEFDVFLENDRQTVSMNGCGIPIKNVMSCSKPMDWQNGEGEGAIYFVGRLPDAEEIADRLCEGNIEESGFQKFLANIKYWAIGVIAIALLAMFGKALFPMLSMAKYYLLIAALVVLAWIIVENVTSIGIFNLI